MSCTNMRRWDPGTQKPCILYCLAPENMNFKLHIYHLGSAQKCPASLTESGPSSDVLKQKLYVNRIPGGLYTHQNLRNFDLCGVFIDEEKQERTHRNNIISTASIGLFKCIYEYSLSMPSVLGIRDTARNDCDSAH